MSTEFYNRYIEKQKAKIDEIMQVVIMLEVKLSLSEDVSRQHKENVDRFGQEINDLQTDLNKARNDLNIANEIKAGVEDDMKMAYEHIDNLKAKVNMITGENADLKKQLQFKTEEQITSHNAYVMAENERKQLQERLDTFTAENRTSVTSKSKSKG
jgi:chromosome segregation ATPase